MANSLPSPTPGSTGKKKWTKIKGSIPKLHLGKRQERPYPLASMIPNLVTLMALCAGLSSLRFALLERWEFAVTAILVAAILDVLDGALARMLNTSSRFGAELDSLSDFATFGISPALIMYFVTLKAYGPFGWVFVLWFCVCGALRLARFNTRSIEGTNPVWAKGFFTGTPIPAGALLALSPLIFHLGYFDFILNPSISAFVMAASGFLMISHLPTFSLKKMHVQQKFILPIVIGIVVTTAGLVSHPWPTLSIAILIYVCTFPLSYYTYKKLEKKNTKID